MKKYILPLIVFAFVFAFLGLNVNTAKADSSCSFSRTLKAGINGDDVMCLQKGLGIFADGKFGPKTKAAVLAWQMKWGLVADGMFGMKSRANWVAHGGNSGNFPDGCESASGYSRTTGQKCYAIPSEHSSVVISGVSGPQKLNVDQQGTWTVTAYDKKGGNLSYSVNWGDEYYAASTDGMMRMPITQQSATFTHSYSQSGIYRPVFTVTNTEGGIAQTSLSVNVGGVADVKKLHIIPASANIKVGETATFQALLTPAVSITETCSSASNENCLPATLPVVQATWTSSDTKVVTVQYKNTCPAGAYCFVATDYLKAVATGVGEGNATIKATYTDASGKVFTDTAAVTVGSFKKPVISYLSPESGLIDSAVTIYGSNFTATGNRVKFGETNTENDPRYNLASNGGSITFAVPSSYYVPCLNATPRCSIASRMVQPGTYEVSVINANGTSNVEKFVVDPTYTTN